MMLQFTKDVLRHSCAWTTNEDTCKSITGFPAIQINVNEGYELIHFVCRYMAYKGWSSQITFNAIESMIKTRLPFAARTHADVKEWLDNNFRR